FKTAFSGREKTSRSRQPKVRSRSRIYRGFRVVPVYDDMAVRVFLLRGHVFDQSERRTSAIEHETGRILLYADNFCDVLSDRASRFPDGRPKISRYLDIYRPRFSFIYRPPLVAARDILLRFFRPYLNKVHERFGRFLKAFARIEFELAVEIMSAGEKIRRRQISERQIRSIGSAADRAKFGIDAGAFRGFDRIVSQFRIIFQNFVHIQIAEFAAVFDLYLWIF